MHGMFKRKLTKILKKYYNSERNVALTGARQVGKSTLLTQIFPSELGISITNLKF